MPMTFMNGSRSWNNCKSSRVEQWRMSLLEQVEEVELVSQSPQPILPDVADSCATGSNGSSDVDNISDDDGTLPDREKRMWMITKQQRRYCRRIRSLESDSLQRRIANRTTHKKRTNFGWMKTVGKYPVAWGKKWKPSNWFICLID